jgi:hypothetical protein
MRFSMNSQPVIKVTSYKKKTKQHKIRKFWDKRGDFYLLFCCKENT